MLFAFQFCPVCNFGKFINFILRTVKQLAKDRHMWKNIVAVLRASEYNSNSLIPSNTIATIAKVRMPVAIYILTSSHQATSHKPTIFHHIDIHHVETQSSSASCAMLTRPNKAETAVHCCWLLSSICILFFLVATGFYPFYHCCYNAHDSILINILSTP